MRLLPGECLLVGIQPGLYPCKSQVTKGRTGNTGDEQASQLLDLGLMSIALRGECRLRSPPPFAPRGLYKQRCVKGC